MKNPSRRLREVAGRAKGPSSDAGFTLVELMVVVLIIGILMAIAIPTFLSTRTSANHTATQSNLTDALITEQSVMAAKQVYSADTAPTGVLATTELNLAWNPYQPSVAETSGNAVYVAVNSDGSDLLLSGLALDGTCYFAVDDAGVTAFATTPSQAKVCSDNASGMHWYDNFKDAATGTHAVATPAFLP